MRLQSPLGFLLFWIVALGAGTAFVLLVVGGAGWPALIAAPALVLLLVGLVGRRSKRRP